MPEMNDSIDFVVVPGYPDYRVRAADGKLQSRRRWGRWKDLRGHMGAQGYIVHGLWDEQGNLFCTPIHVVVAITFKGPCPEGMEVRHLDDNKLNNAAWNLAYGTRQQNVDDARRNGRILRGEDRPLAKLTEANVEDIYRSVACGESQTLIANRLGVSPITVNQIVHGRTWNHVRERVGYTYIKPKPKRNRTRCPRHEMGDTATI